MMWDNEQIKMGDTMKNKRCECCGETGDKTCFTGSGICASENAPDTVTLTTGQTVTCPDVLDTPCWECEHLTVCPKCEYGVDQ